MECDDWASNTFDEMFEIVCFSCQTWAQLIVPLTTFVVILTNCQKLFFSSFVGRSFEGIYAPANESMLSTFPFDQLYFITTCSSFATLFINIAKRRIWLHNFEAEIVKLHHVEQNSSNNRCPRKVDQEVLIKFSEIAPEWKIVLRSSEWACEGAKTCELFMIEKHSDGFFTTLNDKTQEEKEFEKHLWKFSRDFESCLIYY